MAYGFSVPSTRITSYALRAAHGSGLDVVLTTSGLPENSVPGAVIGTLTCTGTIGIPVYSLIDDAAGRIALGGANNATVLAGLVNTDFETTPFFNFTVSVIGVSPQLPNVTFTIDVVDINEYPPVFVSHGGAANVSLSIVENTTAVTVVAATDADIGSVVTYEVTGPDASKFAINSMGELRFAAPPDYERPLSATNSNVYVVTVVASDGKFVDTQTFTVSVTDIYDPVDLIPPTITSASNLPLFENSQLAHQLTADETVTWTITGGADAGLFTIGGVASSVLLLSPKNFESPADADFNNQYIVEITATDTAGLTTNQTITVTVAAVNEFAPVITSNGGTPTVDISVVENTIAVTTVAATDADNDAVTYSITGGADGPRFDINPTTGVLTFKAAPDFEVPTDADSNNQYIVIVQASDGSNTDTQTITVTVTDIADSVDTTPPIITSASSKALAENDPLTHALTASENVTWAITGGADALHFTLTGTPPLVFLTMPAKNYEAFGDANGDNQYIVQITATDAALNAVSQTFTAIVTNVNEFAPVISSNGGGATATITVPENSTIVTAVAAADADAGAVITYSITGGADATKFTINSSTGALAFVSAPDYENPASAAVPPSNQYIVIVQASDGTSTDSQTITVNVTDAAEDTTPDDFAFAPVGSVALNTVIESNTITVTGIAAPTGVTVAGGEYQKNGTGPWLTVANTALNGTTFKVRGMSANTQSTVTGVTLNIGGVSSTFEITTFGVDTTPDPFTFIDVTNAPMGVVLESNSITITGINAPATLTVSTNTQYQLNGTGGWSSATTTVVNGTTVKINGMSSTFALSDSIFQLTVGGVSDTWTITTMAGDTSPDQFTFTDASGVPLSTVVESNAITVSGINVATLMTITGGEYQVGTLPWASFPTTTFNGASIKVRGTSSPSAGTPVDVTLTIGDKSDVFRITTVVTTPAPTLTWTSDDTVLDPVLTLSDYTAMIGDTLTCEVDDNSDFSSLYDSELNVLDSTEVAAGTITYAGFTTLVGGVTYYARVKLQRGAAPPVYSNTVSKLMTGGIDPLAPDAPVLVWATSSAVFSPQFDMDLENPKPGDIIRLRRSSVVGMTSPTTYTHDVTARTVSFGALDFPVIKEANGTSYWQAQHETAGHLSEWSTVVTVTISAVAVPTTPTTMGAFAPAHHTTSVGMGYFSDQHPNIKFDGPESASRYLIIAHASVLNATSPVLRLVTDQDMATGSPAGTVMTMLVQSVISNNRQIGIYRVAIPIGSSGRLVVESSTGPGVFSVVAFTYVMAYAISSAAPATSVTGYANPPDPIVAPSLTIPSGGFSLAFAGMESVSSATWSGGYSTVIANLTSADVDISLAKSTTVGSSTPTLTRGDSKVTILAAAAFGA